MFLLSNLHNYRTDLKPPILIWVSLWLPGWWSHRSYIGIGLSQIGQVPIFRSTFFFRPICFFMNGTKNGCFIGFQAPSRPTWHWFGGIAQRYRADHRGLNINPQFWWVKTSFELDINGGFMIWVVKRSCYSCLCGKSSKQIDDLTPESSLGWRNVAKCVCVKTRNPPA